MPELTAINITCFEILKSNEKHLPRDNRSCVKDHINGIGTMSVKVMTAVFDRYPNGGGEMLLALALADHAHDNGQHIFPGVTSLMKKTRQSERSVQNQLRAMINSGWLIPTGNSLGGAGNKREYRISPEWLAGATFEELKKGAEIAPLQKGAIDAEKGANSAEKGCNPQPPLITVVEPSVNRQGAKRASRLPKDWKFPKEYAEWARTEFPAWNDAYLKKVATMFYNHWTAKSTDAAKLDWFATWQNWCYKEPAAPKELQANAGAAAISGDWWKSSVAITEKGKSLNPPILQQEQEQFPHFRDRVYVAAGPGPWEALLPATRSHEPPSAATQKGNAQQFLKEVNSK